MTTTETLNLPAAAALAAAEPDLTEQVEEVRTAAHADYSEQTKPELWATLTKVRGNRPPHVRIAQPASNATKAELVTVLANAAADMSRAQEQLDTLRSDVRREQEILDKVAETPTIEELRAERNARIAEVAASWDADRIADVAYAYETEMARAASWESVGSIMRNQGKSPAEAVAFVVDYQTREVVMNAGRMPRGWSTSMTTNLAREAKLAGQTKFIEEARWLG